MSIELANEKWIDSNEAGLLGQFASTKGYSDLIKAAFGYAELSRFFRDGATDKVEEVRAELRQLIRRTSPDVASTAKALLALSMGETLLIIANGAS